MRGSRGASPTSKAVEPASRLALAELHFTPVGKMFFQGAPRLLKAGVAIPQLHAGDLGEVLGLDLVPRALVLQRSPFSSIFGGG